MFIFSVSSKVLGPIFTKLGRKVEGGPDISLRGSFFERSRSSRSKVKFMGFFCLFPYFSQVLHFLKGQGHRGQRSNLCFFSVCSPTSPRSLDRSSPNLVGRLRAAPILARGVHFLKSRSSRSKVKFLYLGSPWSNLHETW